MNPIRFALAIGLSFAAVGALGSAPASALTLAPTTGQSSLTNKPPSLENARWRRVYRPRIYRYRYYHPYYRPYYHPYYYNRPYYRRRFIVPFPF